MTQAVRRAFSLLEIILSLAILAGAVAVLGQLTRTGLEDARLARDSTQAQLYCESKMAEIAAGLVSATAESNAPLVAGDGTTVPGWLASVEVNGASQTGLLEIRVTVSQDPSTYTRPVEYTLVRWIPDPSATSSSATSSDSSTSSSTSAASQGSNAGGSQ